MPVLPLVLGLLVTVAGPAQTDAAGYRPTGSLVDLHDLGRLALLRAPGVRPLGFSSYDRSGGNDDGFKGTYSRIRAENGNSVLAEIDGPGIIQRIWFTHSMSEHTGLLDRKGEHIRIYLDGHAEPALDIPLEDLFNGRRPRFPKPLVGEGSGGFVSYVPIAFRAGCKVVVEGLAVRFYQINLVTLPNAEGVVTFTEELPQVERAHLERAVALWSRPESFGPLALNDTKQASYAVDAIERTSLTFALPDGPETIRSLEVLPSTATSLDWLAARLRLVWDSDDPATAGVDLPLGYAFGQALDSQPYHSLLVGQTEQGWYQRFPMPYRKHALLRLDTDRPIKGTIRVVTVNDVDPAAGYFRAHYNEALPTRPNVDFAFLKDQGRGHYAGVLLATEGKARLPFWLEGDDRFVVDGLLAIHGTGTEDYFNCGWYALKGRLDQPATYPSHGFPVYGKNGETMRAVAFRWHVADPVCYTRSITAGIEHGEVNTYAADYRAAVFWYSESPGTAHARDR